MNCLSCFSRIQRMEGEYYKDIIITWPDRSHGMQIHDDVLPRVFWAGGKTASYFYRSVEIWCSPPSKHEAFTQYCFNVGPTTATLANIETALLWLLGCVTALRPNACDVHTSTLLVGVPCTANVAQPGHAWRHRTDLIIQLDRGRGQRTCWPSELYIHVVHWVDL